ncbi:MAG: epimerase [Geobacteraceae bacterium GWC2_53_11]|nr:MAG: epimerase [Geobacteraceae bacterium GWC2_53_11]
MKILVTGATGFIGNHVVASLLERGHVVTAVARDPSRAIILPWYGRATFIPCDIYGPEALKQLQPANFDTVMHLAWPGLPNYKALSHLDQTFQAECLFLKGLIQSGIPHLLVSGTCFEYGLRQGCLNEAMTPNPATPYAVAKNSLRCYLESLKKELPFRLQWARLFYMHGVGQNPGSLLAQLDSAIERGDELFNMSGGEQLRDYLKVEEITSYLIALIEHPASEGIINVCSGIPISVRKLVEDFIDKRGASIRLNLGYYKYPDYEPMAFWGDSTKLRQVLHAPEDTAP